MKYRSVAGSFVKIVAVISRVRWVKLSLRPERFRNDTISKSWALNIPK